jgi:hypothetical protein
MPDGSNAKSVSELSAEGIWSIGEILDEILPRMDSSRVREEE